MAYYVFVAATGVITLVAVMLFVLRAEKVRTEMKNKRDRPMMAYLAIAIVSLFAFIVLFAGFTDPEISLPLNAGLVILLIPALLYEVYLVLRSNPAKS